jgi:hypothetical protein
VAFSLKVLPTILWIIGIVLENASEGRRWKKKHVVTAR